MSESPQDRSTSSPPRRFSQGRSQGLRADDLAGPSLVFCARVEMCDLHLHRLYLQVLRGHAGHFVSDLVALDGDVLALDAETKARMSRAKAIRDTAVIRAEQLIITIMKRFMIKETQNTYCPLFIYDHYLVSTNLDKLTPSDVSMNQDLMIKVLFMFLHHPGHNPCLSLKTKI